ncbi:hypothetical protein GCM10009434_12990 [Brevundimonas olei]
MDDTCTASLASKGVGAKAAFIVAMVKHPRALRQGRTLIGVDKWPLGLWMLWGGPPQPRQG